MDQQPLAVLDVENAKTEKCTNTSLMKSMEETKDFTIPNLKFNNKSKEMLSSPSDEFYNIDSSSMKHDHQDWLSTIHTPDGCTQQESAFSITRVHTSIMTNITDIDPNLACLIQQLSLKPQGNLERLSSMVWSVENHSDRDRKRWASKKASMAWYLFFLCSTTLFWAVGSVVLLLMDFEPHFLVYLTIFCGLLFLFTFLDWYDNLRDFISWFENCWNWPKRSIHIEVKWQRGETEECRRLRKHVQQHIGAWIKDYLSWNGLWLVLLCRVESKIVDDSVVVTGMLSNRKLKIYNNKMKVKDKLKSDILKDEILRANLKNCNCDIKGCWVTKHVDHRARYVFMALFFIFAFVAYILLQVTDDEDGYELPIWLTNLADICFYTAIFFMILATMSNWTMISFQCSEKAYLQGLLIVSIVGFLLLTIARILRPPASVEIDEITGKEKSKIQDVSEITWHKKHNWSKQIGGVVFTVVILWIFFVFFFVISVAAFAEFAEEAATWGVGPALSCYVAFSFVIMLAPPAPGNIIDVFGGFLFVTVLIRNDSETWNFWTATILAIISIGLLHYTGACLQWLIGKRPFAQQWMNRTFPIEMLATSDAVLGEANWFKVGLVGFVFLDTANGLNQGRIEMEFWTQLLSEWGAWPNGLCLTTFGATLALSGLSCGEGESTGCLNSDTSWTAQAIPMLFLMSGITQIVGTSLGAGSLAGSVDSERYIMSREKWMFVHTFMKIGYIPTKKGWKEDVYELAKSEDDNREPYFVRACQLQRMWLEKRKRCENAGKITEENEKFKWQQWIPLRYKDHLTYLLRKMKNMEDEEPKKFGELFKTKRKEDLIRKRGLWDDAHKNKRKQVIQVTLASILVISFYICMLGFYISLELEVAVSEGLDVLSKIQWYYWVAAVLFIVCSCVYYWDYLTKSLVGTFTGLLYLIKCCPTDQEVETGFLTPVMEMTTAMKTRTPETSTPGKKTAGMAPVEEMSEEDTQS